MAKKSSFRLGKWIILVFAIILGLVLSLVNFFVLNPAKEYVSARIELLYDGAAEGLAPNGQPFSMDGIKDGDLLETAIEESGLIGTVSAEELAQNMMVRGSYPSNIIEKIKSVSSLFSSDPTREVAENEYYPTTYGISIYNNFKNKLSAAQLKSLLFAVISGYKQYYVDNYSSGVQWSSLEDIWEPEAYDYSQTITTLSLRLDMIRKYAKELYDAEPTFALADGSNFSSIMLRADNIAANDLQSLSANITINALSKDVTRLRSQYNYEIEQLTYKLSGLNTELANINTLIEKYDKDSDIYYNSGDSIVTVEGQSKETYEALADKKASIANEISAILISIDDYRERVNDLDTSTESGNADAYTERITAAIDAARKKIDELAADFDKMAEGYNAEYVRSTDVSSTEVRHYGNKLVSTSFIKAIIKSEAPVCAVALVVIAFIGLVAELKKQKSKKA